MVPLDWLLGAAEVVLVPVSLIWLGRAVAQPARRRLGPPALLTVVVALTLAQPFGIVADPLGEQAAPASAEPVDPEGVHIAQLVGSVPAMPFRLYSREILRPFPLENVPTQTLRARSWFWAPLLSNSTKVDDICGDAFEPVCWRPEPESYPPLTPGSAPVDNPYATSLTLASDDGEYWATLTSPYAEEQPPVVPRSFTWKLSAGIASPFGVGYWVVGGVLLFLAWRGHRKARDST